MVMEQDENARTAKDDDVVLRLEDFLPYQLSLTSNTISGEIAKLYATKFNLPIAQWRVMAVIGRVDGLSAREVGERTAMDKVAVSRAVKALEDASRLHREISPEDRRRSVLSLTSEGRVVYNQIAPIAIDFEQRLLQGTSESERKILATLLERLFRRAKTLS